VGIPASSLEDFAMEILKQTVQTYGSVDILNLMHTEEILSAKF